MGSISPDSQLHIRDHHLLLFFYSKRKEKAILRIIQFIPEVSISSRSVKHQKTCLSPSAGDEVTGQNTPGDVALVPAQLGDRSPSCGPS